MDKEQLEDHLMDLEREKKTYERKSFQVMNGPFQYGLVEAEFNGSMTAVARQP